MTHDYYGTKRVTAWIADKDGKPGFSVKYIDMKTATGEMQPGWLASQTDMLSDDWQIVE